MAGFIFNIAYCAVCAFMAILYLSMFALCIDYIYRKVTKQ